MTVPTTGVNFISPTADLGAVLSNRYSRNSCVKFYPLLLPSRITSPLSLFDRIIRFCLDKRCLFEFEQCISRDSPLGPSFVQTLVYPLLPWARPIFWVVPCTIFDSPKIDADMNCAFGFRIYSRVGHPMLAGAFLRIMTKGMVVRPDALLALYDLQGGIKGSRKPWRPLCPSCNPVASPISLPVLCRLSCLAINGSCYPSSRRSKRPPIHLLGFCNPWVCRPRAPGSLTFASPARS